MTERERTIKTEIDGYEVELVIRDSGEEPRTECWVRSPSERYMASLACLQGEGVLYHVSDCTSSVKVNERTVERISEWAEENGY